VTDPGSSFWGALGIGPGLTALLTLIAVTALASVKLWRELTHDRRHERDPREHPSPKGLETIPTAIAIEVRNALSTHLLQLEILLREWSDRQRIEAEQWRRELRGDLDESVERIEKAVRRLREPV
jgi:hypothetical protein